MAEKHGIRDVAAAAQVSVGTVSKVFNRNSANNIHVSEATRKRVLEAAARLNYTANYGATLLRGQSSKTLGFIVNLPEELESSYFSDYPTRILSGLAPEAAREGYQLLLITGGDYRSILDIKRVDALIVIGFRMVDNKCCAEMIETFRRFNDLHYPYVVINNVCTAIPVPSINIDNRRAMELIAERIAAQGYRSVGFVGEQTANPQSHHCERMEILGELLAAKGIAYPEASRLNGIGKGIAEIPREGAYSQRDGIAVVRFLAQNHQLPRCLVCGNDTIAQGVLLAAYELGIRVPEELAVIGFDDMPGAAFFAPPLTTIHHPLEEMGRLAFRHIVRKLAEPDYFEQHNVMPTLSERISG